MAEMTSLKDYMTCPIPEEDLEAIQQFVKEVNRYDYKSRKIIIKKLEILRNDTEMWYPPLYDAFNEVSNTLSEKHKKNITFGRVRCGKYRVLVARVRDNEKGVALIPFFKDFGYINPEDYETREALSRLSTYVGCSDLLE